ncbi:hypothetical protein ACFLXT_02685 [Chloroflexota bacterium]
MVMLKVIAALLAIVFTIWVAWQGFGKEVIMSKTFMLVVVSCGALGFMIYYTKSTIATHKETSKRIDDMIVKIDGLIDEIRQARNERNNNAKGG